MASIICNRLTSGWVFMTVVLLARFSLVRVKLIMYSLHVLLGSTVGEVHCETSREGTSCHAYIVRFVELTLQFCK